MTVWVSASRSMTFDQVWQLFPIPCSRSSAGPSPARTKARLCPWTTRLSATWRGGIAPVHHVSCCRGVTSIPRSGGRRCRPLPRRVLVALDERQQPRGVLHDAERVQPPAVEVPVVHHAPELGQQR